MVLLLPRPYTIRSYQELVLCDTAPTPSVMFSRAVVLACSLFASLAVVPVDAGTKLTWAKTKFLFTLGDSYTADGFNISAGVNSPVPGYVRSHHIYMYLEN
jgi:hypothetical protein